MILTPTLSDMHFLHSVAGKCLAVTPDDRVFVADDLAAAAHACHEAGVPREAVVKFVHVSPVNAYAVGSFVAEPLPPEVRARYARESEKFRQELIRIDERHADRELDNPARKGGDTCPDCGGQMQWCDICGVWSQVCCREYDACECS